MTPNFQNTKLLVFQPRKEQLEVNGDDDYSDDDDDDDDDDDEALRADEKCTHFLILYCTYRA